MSYDADYVRRITAAYCDGRVRSCICGCNEPLPVNKTVRRDKRPLARFLRGHNRRLGVASRHGMTLTPEYLTYHSAKDRCTNKKNARWKDYGKRGILFKFESFEQFFLEVGKRPEGMSIERKNVNGNYEIGNVKWATRVEQANNRRNSPCNFFEFEPNF